MSFADERRAIEGRLADNFTALPVRFDNLPFDQPHDAGFVALSIRAGQARQVSTGPRPLHRHTGTIQLDIFVPEDSGTQVSRAHADSLAAIFRGARFAAGDSGTITCRTPRIDTPGVRDGWHLISLRIPYQRDHLA